MSMIFSLIPLFASIVSLLFAGKLIRQFKNDRKNNSLLWTISMLFYAMSAFGEFYGLLVGMNPVIYKMYYISAVTLVAVMAVGQVYFISNKWGHIFLGLTGIGLLIFIVHTTIVSVDLTAFTAGTVVGGEAMPPDIRQFYPPILSGIGGIVLMLGAFWSWWKTRKRSPLMIVVGSLVLMAAGRLATLGYPQWLPLSELAGITIMYYGFIGAKQNRPQTSSTAV